MSIASLDPHHGERGDGHGEERRHAAVRGDGEDRQRGHDLPAAAAEDVREPLGAPARLPRDRHVEQLHPGVVERVAQRSVGGHEQERRQEAEAERDAHRPHDEQARQDRQRAADAEHPQEPGDEEDLRDEAEPVLRDVERGEELPSRSGATWRTTALLKR